MPVTGMDHVAIPAGDPEALIGFYRALGFSIIHEDEWRSGDFPMFAIACGDQKINVHDPILWRNPRFGLRGPTAEPGCGDFCFVWSGAAESAAAAIEAAGGEVIEGPASRVGGRASGTAQGVSVYTRDPDGNLVELISYDERLAEQDPGMDVFEVMQTARAMRRYKPDPIPETVLVQLIEAAHLGPSGSNRQSRHWIVVRDPEVKRQLADLNRVGVTTYLKHNRDVANPHVDQGRRERFLAAVEHQMHHMHEAPAIVIACADLVQAPQGTFNEGSAAATEVWGAVQNLLLAARALKVGSVPTTLAFIGDGREQAQAVLDLPDHILPMVLIPLGWPTGNFGPIRRRPLDEVLHWDHYERTSDSSERPQV